MVIFKVFKYLRFLFDSPSYIYRIFSNPIRTWIQSALVFVDFLNEKTKLVRGSNPHISFNRPLPTRQSDSVTSDDGESDE